MNPASPRVILWAAIVRAEAVEWIHYGTIRRTRKEARAAYLAAWIPARHARALARVRFARVVVSLAEPQEPQP